VLIQYTTNVAKHSKGGDYNYAIFDTCYFCLMYSEITYSAEFLGVDVWAWVNVTIYISALLRPLYELTCLKRSFSCCTKYNMMQYEMVLV